MLYTTVHHTNKIMKTSLTKKASYKWEVLAILWFAYFVNQADRQVFNTVLPAIRDALSLTDENIGLIATIFNLFYACMVPIGGWAGDRFSRKWVTTFSILFWSVATMFTGLANGMFLLILMRSVATGGGEAFFGPANYALLGQYHTDTRAKAMSIHQTAYYVGIILAGYLAGLIADTLGWQYSFIIFGAVGVVWGIYMIFRLHDKDDDEPQADVAAPAAQVEKPGFFDGFKTVFTTPTALMLTIGFSGLIFVITGYLTWMTAYLHENFGQSLAQAGFNSMAYTHIAAFVGVLIAGSLSDKFAEKYPQARMYLQGIGLVVAAPFLVLMGLVSEPSYIWVLYIGLAGFGFCRAFFDANTYSVLYAVTPQRLHASCSSAMIMTGFGVGAFAPLALGVIKAHVGLQPSFFFLAAIWLVCGVAMLIVAKTCYKKDLVKE